jgi:hypothetical protein
VSVLTGGALLYTSEFADAVDSIRNRLRIASLSGTLPYLAKCLAYNVGRTPFLYRWISSVPGLRLGEPRVKPLQDLTTMLPFAQRRISCVVSGLLVRPGALQLDLSAIIQRHSRQFLDLGGVISGDHALPLLRYPMLVASESTSREIARRLVNVGVGATRLYERPLRDIAGVPPIVGGPWPNAGSLAARLITLPLHSGVRHRHVRLIEQTLERSASVAASL